MQLVLLHKMLIDGLEWCGLLVDYYDVFISCLDSDGSVWVLIAPIHSIGEQVM